MKEQFGIEDIRAAAWFQSKTIIEQVDQWLLRGRRATYWERGTIQRLLEYCLYLMRYNYCLNIFAKNNPDRISSKDRNAILLRDAEFWRLETTFYYLFSCYFLTIIKIFDLQNNLLQDANPPEDLAHVDETLPQHYDVSTAALDWSKDPKVAIYFAFGNTNTETKFLKIYALRVHNHSDSPIRIMEASPLVENERAKRQEGVFSYFVKPCSFYLQHGEFPSIDYFDSRYKNNLNERTFELREFIIKRSEYNLKFLGSILSKHGIDKCYLFPDLCNE